MAQAQRWQLIGIANQRHAAGPFGERRDRDLSLALRYGVARDLELNAALHRSRRVLRGGGIDAAHSRDLMAIGGTWRLHREGRWPALLLHARASLPLGSPEGESAVAGELGATIYRSVDPVVLSLNLAASRRAAYRDAGERVAPGDSWRAEPLVSFAVNPRVTLSGGLRLQRVGATRIGGAVLPAARGGMALTAAVGYAPDRRHTVFITGEVDGGHGEGSLGLQWYYQF